MSFLTRFDSNSVLDNILFFLNKNFINTWRNLNIVSTYLGRLSSFELVLYQV